MSFRRQILLHVLVLGAILAVFELTSIDLNVQDRCYDRATRSWLIDRNEPVGRAIFYTGAKALVVAVGISCGLAVVASFARPALRPYRRGCLLVTLATIFVPLIVAGSKQFTNVYLPRQIQRYGGDKPYVKVLEHYPPGYKQSSRGKGFPAGHATAGFALMMSYFAFRRRAWKIAGLAAGVVLGWVMGLYQTLDGQHYLSHTLVTQSASWIIILLIHRLSRLKGVAKLFGAESTN